MRLGRHVCVRLRRYCRHSGGHPTVPPGRRPGRCIRQRHDWALDARAKIRRALVSRSLGRRVCGARQSFRFEMSQEVKVHLPRKQIANTRVASFLLVLLDAMCELQGAVSRSC
jgi:hypothetical protein